MIRFQPPDMKVVCLIGLHWPLWGFVVFSFSFSPLDSAENKVPAGEKTQKPTECVSPVNMDLNAIY